MAVLSAKDTDKIIDRCGKGNKIVSGDCSVTGSYCTDTGLDSTITILHVGTRGKGKISGQIHDVIGYISDTTDGHIMLKVYITDAVGDVTESSTATDVVWCVLGN